MERRKKTIEIKQVTALEWSNLTDLNSLLPAVAKDIPGGSNFLPSAVDNGDLKLDERYTQPSALEATKDSAIAAMATYGLSADQTCALAGEMIDRGLAEPYSVYQYLTEVGSMGRMATGSSGSLLTVAKYLLEKTRDPKLAISYLKTACDIASKYPEMDLMALAAGSISNGTNPVGILLASSIGATDEESQSIREAAQFLEFIQNPSREKGKLLWNIGKSRQKRRTMQQLNNEKANLAFMRVMWVANERTTAVMAGWYKEFDKNPAIKALLPLVEKAYEVSTIFNTLGKASGIIDHPYSEGVGTKLDPSTLTKGGSSNNRLVVAATPPSATNGGAPPAAGAPASNASMYPKTPPPTKKPDATENPMGEGYDNLLSYLFGETDGQTSADGQYIYEQIQKYRAHKKNLEKNIKSGNDLIGKLVLMLSAETVGDDNNKAGPGISAGGMEGAGMLAPGNIAVFGDALLANATVDTEINNNMDSIRIELFSIYNRLKPKAKSEQLAEYVEADFRASNTLIETNKAEILTIKSTGIWAKFFGPTWRKINMISIALHSVTKQIEISKGAGGVAGKINALTLQPLYQQEIGILWKLVGLYAEGIENINQAQQQEADDKNISSMLYMLKSKLYYKSTTTVAEINALQQTIAYQFMPDNGENGAAAQGRNPFSAVNKKMIREAKSPFDQDDKEEGSSPLYRDADKAIKDYWNGLLSGYGTKMDDPKSHRDETTDYKPKFRRRRKKIIYRVN